MFSIVVFKGLPEVKNIVEKVQVLCYYFFSSPWERLFAMSLHAV